MSQPLITLCAGLKQYIPPPPCHFFGKQTTNNWSKRTGNCPNTSNDSIISTTISVNMSALSSHVAHPNLKTYLGLNKSPIVMLTSTTSPPPDIPWIALAAINIPILIESPAIRLPTKNPKFATRRTGFRP